MNNWLSYDVEISEKEKNILERVYKHIFVNFSSKHVDIFLCGGELEKKSFRKNLKTEFENYNHIKVFYPEIVFAEYFNLNKSADYLELENILGEQVDFICIVCESWGAVTELGAFANKDKLKNKVIALNHIKHQNSNSFISLGPIKFLKKNNSDSVFYYEDNNEKELCKSLNSKFKKYIKEHDTFRDIDKITGMFYFVSLILYFFKKLDKALLNNYIKYVIFDLLEKDRAFKFEAIFSATKKLLFNESFIIKNGNDFLLTKKGEIFISELLNKKEHNIYNDIIADIIGYRY